MNRIFILIGVLLFSSNSYCQNADFYNNRGLDKFEKHDYVGAISDFNKVITLNPNFEDIFILRGIAKAENKDIRGAFSDYNKAIKITPNNYYVYSLKGLLEISINDKINGCLNLRKAYKLDPIASIDQMIKSYCDSSSIESPKSNNSSIFKLQTISNIQEQKLRQAGLNIPKNNMVINEYDAKKDILIMSQIQYDDNDRPDGLYFDEYVSYNVIILNIQDIILCHNSLGRALTTDCLIDLKQGIKISYDYSLTPGGTGGFEFYDLNDKKIDNKVLRSQLKNKHGLYFDGDKFWNLIAKFDKK